MGLSPTRSPLVEVTRVPRLPWWRRTVAVPVWLMGLLLVIGTFEWYQAVFR